MDCRSKSPLTCIRARCSIEHFVFITVPHIWKTGLFIYFAENSKTVVGPKPVA